MTGKTGTGKTLQIDLDEDEGGGAFSRRGPTTTLSMRMPPIGAQADDDIVDEDINPTTSYRRMRSRTGMGSVTLPSAFPRLSAGRRMAMSPIRTSRN